LKAVINSPPLKVYAAADDKARFSLITLLLFSSVEIGVYKVLIKERFL
jgi:hypothetical protein